MTNKLHKRVILHFNLACSQEKSTTYAEIYLNNEEYYIDDNSLMIWGKGDLSSFKGYLSSLEGKIGRIALTFLKREGDFRHINTTIKLEDGSCPIVDRAIDYVEIPNETKPGSPAKEQEDEIAEKVVTIITNMTREKLSSKEYSEKLIEVNRLMGFVSGPCAYRHGLGENTTIIVDAFYLPEVAEIRHSMISSGEWVIQDNGPEISPFKEQEYNKALLNHTSKPNHKFKDEKEYGNFINKDKVQVAKEELKAIIYNSPNQLPKTAYEDTLYKYIGYLEDRAQNLVNAIESIKERKADMKEESVDAVKVNGYFDPTKWDFSQCTRMNTCKEPFKKTEESLPDTIKYLTGTSELDSKINEIIGFINQQEQTAKKVAELEKLIKEK